MRPSPHPLSLPRQAELRSRRDVDVSAEGDEDAAAQDGERLGRGQVGATDHKSTSHNTLIN